MANDSRKPGNIPQHLTTPVTTSEEMEIRIDALGKHFNLIGQLGWGIAAVQTPSLSNGGVMSGYIASIWYHDGHQPVTSAFAMSQSEAFTRVCQDANPILVNAIALLSESKTRKVAA